MSSPPDPQPRVYAGATAAERQARQRRQFLDAGLTCFGTQGYRSATIRSLCKEAGLTDRYFYRNFSDVEALLVAVYEQSMDRIEVDVLAALAAHAGDPDRAITAGLDAFFEAFSDARVARVCWIEVLGVSDRVNAAYTARVQRFADLFAAFGRASAPALDVADDELALVAVGVVGAISQSAAWWYLSGYAAPRAVVVSATARLARAAVRSVAR